MNFYESTMNRPTTSLFSKRKYRSNLYNYSLLFFTIEPLLDRFVNITAMTLLTFIAGLRME